MKKYKTANVCVITYRRPELLIKCLNSINTQTLSSNIEISIIVVDNDVEESAKEVVGKFKEKCRFKIYYFSEKKKNISSARNRCIAESNGDVIVFIDDDEIACSDWLENHILTLEKYECSSVQGPVIPTYPKGTPGWIIESGVFERKPSRTGDILKLAITGNVSIVKDDIGDLLFDERYGLTGGGDTDFFRKFTKNKKKIMWSDYASVFEEVSQDRMKYLWILKRGFRVGQTTSKMKVENFSRVAKIRFILHQTLLIVASSLRVIFTVLYGKASFVKYSKELFVRIGRVSGALLGDIYVEYK